MTSFRVRERVCHPIYGDGVVEAVLQPTHVGVRFDGGLKYIAPRNLTSLEQRAREQEQRARERNKQALLRQIRYRLRNKFLEAEPFFRSADPKNLVSKSEFKRELIRFMKGWIAKNVPATQSHQAPIPDEDQLAAIGAAHGHVQVVARAGSGKTTVLVNHAFFLTKHCKVSSDKILILAFNKKAVAEVRKRLLFLLCPKASSKISEEIDRRRQQSSRSSPFDIELSAVNAIAKRSPVDLPHVMTFHALAYALVHPEEQLIYDEEENPSFSRVVQDVIDDHLRDRTFRHKIRDVMLAHFRDDWDRIIEGRYDQDRDELLRFRRLLPRESLDGVPVKSRGEKLIADFLFEHNIRYTYERTFHWDDTIYRPDFSIGREDGIVIEYFGLAGDPDYDEESQRKRIYWENNPRWKLIEFTPDDIRRNGLTGFTRRLKRCLEEQGLSCDRLSEDEIWRRVRKRAIDRFTTVVRGVIAKCRSLSWSADELERQILSHGDDQRFLNLVHSLYRAYLERLKASGEEDFNGLIQRACERIDKGHPDFARKDARGDLRNLRYVCIDEFQDFSPLFSRMLEAAKRQNSEIKVFCVGDDWQAINRFAGADLRFFQHFDRHVGISRKHHILRNYRSHTSIVSVGNSLMREHGTPAIATGESPGQVLVADIGSFEPNALERERHPYDFFTPAVLRVVNKGLADNLEVVMLSRTNEVRSYGRTKSKRLQDFLALIRENLPEDRRKRVSISTVHKFKGLEKPMIIILDAVESRYPLVNPVWMFYRIFGESLDNILNDERRLFYVALTRAIERLVIFTDSKSMSPFLRQVDRSENSHSIDWKDFPFVGDVGTSLHIKIGNQNNRDSSPTHSLRVYLKECGYRWQSKQRVWEKSWPVERFELNLLKSETWTDDADGIEVRIVDGTDSVLARYEIDRGSWLCICDKLATS